MVAGANSPPSTPVRARAPARPCRLPERLPLERAADLLNPGSHAGQTEAGVGPRGRQAPAVVVDLEDGTRALLTQPHVDPGRVCVLADVGQGLLQGAQQDHL